LKPDLKTSVMTPNAVLDLRNLVREYYNLMDCRCAYVNKLRGIQKESSIPYSLFSRILRHFLKSHCSNVSRAARKIPVSNRFFVRQEKLRCKNH